MDVVTLAIAKRYTDEHSGGSADAYTKSETDTLLTAKADKATTYTKSETDTRITEKVAEIVAGAPEDFDTLKEMSDWIDSHEDSAAAMNTAIQANTTAIAGKVDKVSGKNLSTEDYTTAEKTKLAGIETGAEANIQSDWEQSDNTADDFIKNKPTLGSAASRSVVLSLSNAGSGLPTSGTVYSALENKVDKVTGKGLSTEDYTTAEKTKLAGLSNYDDSALQTAVSNKVDKVTGKGLSTEDYTTAEKTKLAGIETGANKTTVDSALSSSSTNPVQNQAVYTALNSKVDVITGKQLSTEDYTTAEKTKLEGIETGATSVTVDREITKNSTNPVSSFAIWDALDEKAGDIARGDKAVFDSVYGLGTAITSGTDLDSLTTPGNYYSPSSSISVSLLNCPLPYNGFRLNVYYTSSTARIEQELIPNVVDTQCHEIYKRSIVSGTAGVWYKFVGEAVQVSGTNETSTSETI